MACEHPIPALIDSRFGKNRIFFHWSECPGVQSDSSDLNLLYLPVGVRRVELPCGKCFSCKQSRAFNILVRAVAESRMCDFSSFITLTCSDEFYQFVFPGGVLNHRSFQLFAKRLRKKIGKFRYLMCGEYGENTGRCHYHVVVFGHRFVDSFISNNTYYCSRVLYDAWPYGHIKCDDVCNERLAYVAGYQLKQYQTRDGVSSYVKWSRRPGLGYFWLRRYWRDLLSADGKFTFVLNGRRCNISCRYFFEKFACWSPEDYAILKAQRANSMLLVDDDETHIMRHDAIVRHAMVLKHKQQQRKVDRL